MSLDLISAILFYIIIAIVLYKNRHKLDVIERIIFIYRSKKPIKFMEKLASFSFLWKVVSTVAIPVAFYFMLVLLTLLVGQAVTIVTQPDTPAGVGILIPGIRIPGSPIYVPFWYGIISLAFLIVVHEFSHGIVAINERIKVKSSGVGMALVIPMAFVEPDEEDMKAATRLSRLRVISIASVMNILSAYIIAFLILLPISPFVESLVHLSGVTVTTVVPGTPAEAAGLPVGVVITSIDGTAMANITHFSELLQQYSPNDTISLATSAGAFDITLTAQSGNASQPYMGVYFEQAWDFRESVLATTPLPLLNAVMFIWFCLQWMANLSIMVGIMNLLPIWVADGGQFVFQTLGYVIRDEKKLIKLCNIIYYLCLLLLLFNLVGPYIL
jgi:membrane-associated protease RseP (regulator of RpoE activity)